MATQWNKTEFGKVATFRYGRMPVKKSDTGLYPVFSGYRITGYTDENYNSDENLIVVARGVGGTGDIKISPKRSFVTNLSIIVDLEESEVNRDFLYYYFSKGLRYLDTGSAQSQITIQDLKRLDVVLPPYGEQKGIAEVLLSLDKKIELLHKQNETLEQIAKTIFNEWFVEFNFPNEKGQTYKASGGKMIESELGEIPEGWSIRGFSKIAEFLNGLALQKFPSKDKSDEIPAIKIRELNSGITEQTDRVSRSVPERYIVHNGDLLFSWSGSLEVVIWQHGIGALNQHLFKVTSGNYPKWFLYLWLLNHLPFFRSIAENKATTMGHIQRIHLEQARVLIPSSNNLKEMDLIMSPIFEKFIFNNMSMKSLIATRGLLLPKLINGEIRVKL